MVYFLAHTRAMANFLESFFSKVGAFKPGGSVLGIDIGTSSVKIVQLKRKSGKAVLETYGELALGPYAGLEIGQAVNLGEEKMIQALTDIMREARVTSKEAGVSIPFSTSLVSLIELPHVSEKELASMVPIEARKYIPVPIGEVTLDWWLIPREIQDTSEEELETKEAEGKAFTDRVEVLVAAIHNDTMQRYQAIGRRLGLQNPFFEIELFSTLRGVIRRDIGAIMVVDIGASTTKAFVSERGVLKTSHTINRGSQDITLALSRSMNIPIRQAEELKREHGLVGNADDAAIRDVISLSTDYIFSEASRIALNFERRYNKSIQKVVFTGGGALLKEFTREAARALEAEVVLGNPFSNVEAPAFLGDVLREAGPEFAVAIGLALRKLEEH